MPDTSNDAKAGKSEPLNRSTLLTRDNLRIARWKPRGARPFRPLAAAKVRVSFAKETMRGELVEAAREQEDELTPTDGGGLRWTAEGNDGCIARVNFPAPSLKSKIEGDGKPIVKIKELAGAIFSRLFIPTITFKPVENFRDEARALLAKAEANKLIKLCQTESAPRVSFETTERSAVTA